jgi:WD40 repeat protein
VRERQATALLRDARILNAALAEADPLIAALLIAELNPRREPPAGARSAREIASRPIPMAVLARGSGRLLAVAISPDGNSVLTGYDDGVVMVWPADGSGNGVIRQRLQGAVHRVAFDDNGIYALANTGAGNLRVWRAGGDDVAPWGGGPHPGRVLAAAFGPNGRLVTAADDGTVRAWTVAAPGNARTYTGGGAATEVAVSADGRWIGVVSGKSARAWHENATESDHLELTGHTDPIVTIAFDAAGARAVTASHDGTVRMWDLHSGAGQVVFTSDRGARSAEFTGDDQHIIAATHDGSVVVIDVDRNTTRRVATHRGGAWIARAAPDGQAVVSAGSDSIARIAFPGAETHVLAGHRGVVFDVASSSDGARFVTASVDGSVRVWGAPDRAEPLVLRALSPARAGTIDDSGRTVAIGTDDGTAWLWSLDNRSGRTLSGHTDGVRTISFDGSGSRVLTGSWDGTARLWDASADTLIAILQGPGASVAAAHIDAAGLRIVTAYDASSARLWSAPDYSRWAELQGHTDLVRDVAIDAAGVRVATASADNTARLWRAADALPLGVLRHHGVVTTAAFAHDRPRLVTASEDSTATVWDVATGEAEFVLRGHEDAVFSAAFSRDDERVVTASADGTARVWSIDGVADPVVLRGHRRDVLGARFSHDGTRIVTVSTDSTARVFPIRPPGEATVLTGHAGVVRDAFFTPDNTRVVTISEDGTARVWRVTWETLHAYISTASTACLDHALRMQVLGESEARARSRHQDCERNHGRTPYDAAAPRE